MEVGIVYRYCLFFCIGIVMKTYLIFGLKICSVFAFFLGVANAGAPPKIGGQASVSLSVGEAGIVNLAGASQGKVNLKQSVGAVLAGNISGGLSLNVTVGKAGIVNAVGDIGGDSNLCQAVGTIGDNCNEGNGI